MRVAATVHGSDSIAVLTTGTQTHNVARAFSGRVASRTFFDLRNL
jgi:hypothetical protein